MSEVAQRRIAWGIWIGIVVVLGTPGSGCLLRDAGHAEERTGIVVAASLCPAASPGGADACPACSTREGGRCRDRYYEHGWRCNSDGDCDGDDCRAGRCVHRDDDGDDLDDAFEQELAERNFPRILAAPGEACGDGRGVIYRARRHPELPSPRRVVLTYVMLYERDCGLNGHSGDNEPFSITVDLDASPGGPAAVGVETVAHFHTLCESLSTCATRPGTSACAVPIDPSAPQVLLYSSRNKHALYLGAGTCERNCLDRCGAGRPIDPSPLLNAGEPDHPLLREVGRQGALPLSLRLATTDPWGLLAFGDAGNIRTQLNEVVAPPGL